MPCLVFAAEINVAVVESRLSSKKGDDAVGALFKKELTALLEGEHKIVFTDYLIEDSATAEDIDALFESAYKNGAVDLVLVLDIAANQIAAVRENYKKPTFFPLVLNAQLLGFPETDGGSGVRNLHYITQNVNLGKELKVLQTITPFRHAVLILDPKIKKSIGAAMQADLLTQAQQNDVTLTIIPFSSAPRAIIEQIPVSVDAVLYGAFPSINSAKIKALIAQINAKGLPSFSLSGERYVRMGALATNHPDTDWQRLARRAAINIQEMLLGTPVKKLPVHFEAASRLQINMATSRKIRVSPSFDVISDAELINAEPDTAAVRYTLTTVVRKAADTNLSLAIQKLRAQQANKRVNEVRANLLPRLDAGLSYQARKDTASTRNGVLAKNTTDGKITLSQPLFNEELWAAFTIEKFSALSEEELLRETELDIIQAAAAAYLNVLREQTSLRQEMYNLEITRENYRLAEARVDVGDSDKSDLYRWQSELANAKQAVLAAKSQLEQRKQMLNRILNRPIAEQFLTTVETLDNPDLLISDDRVTTLITNRYTLDALSDFLVEVGLGRSPELKQLQAQIDADKRQLLSDKRAYWLPDLDFTAQYNDNIGEARAGNIATGDDWIVNIELSLPLYEGGARAARKAQSHLAVMQGEANLHDIHNTVEQEIRSHSEAVHASYQSIALAKVSETSAQKNYDLVSSSYAQGQVNITDLLSAQESLITAREVAMNATYSFLVDMINLQRAIGGFDFFLTDTQRMQFSQEIIQHISNTYNHIQKESR